MAYFGVKFELQFVGATGQHVVGNCLGLGQQSHIDKIFPTSIIIKKVYCQSFALLLL